MVRILLLFILLCCSTALNAQSSAQQKEVQQVVVKFFEALSNRDSVALKKYSTADITLIEYATVWNMDTLIKKAITLNTASDFSRTNSFDFISTEVDHNMAWVLYRLVSDMSRNGNKSTVRWIETVMLVKTKQGWKIRSLHSTLSLFGN